MADTGKNTRGKVAMGKGTSGVDKIGKVAAIKDVSGKAASGMAAPGTTASGKSVPNTDTTIRQILSSKEIKGVWPISYINYIVSYLTGYDLLIERKKKTAKIVMITCIAVTIIGYFIARLFQKPSVWIVFLLLVTSTIAAYAMLRRYSGMDLRDELRLYVGPLIGYLRDDIKRNTAIYLRLFLSKVQNKQFSAGKSAKYENGKYHSCCKYFYRRYFLNLNLRLSDDNYLAITGSEFLILTKKTKKSGKKTKSKNKYKKTDTFTIRLRVNEKIYSLNEEAANATPATSGKLTVSKGQKGTVLKLKYKEKMAGDLVPDPLKTVRAVALLYSFLRRGKIDGDV